MAIVGTEGLSRDGIAQELARGAKFVVFRYCISVVFITFRRSSDVYFIRAGQSRIVAGLPFTLLTLRLGWWRLPWGLIYTPAYSIANLAGGEDVTPQVLGSAGPMI